MRAEEIRHHLTQEPFIPFRLFVSDGSTYDVNDREYIYLSVRELIVGIEIGSNGIPLRTAYVDPVHITRIEPIIDGDNGQPNGSPRR